MISWRISNHLYKDPFSKPPSRKWFPLFSFHKLLNTFERTSVPFRPHNTVLKVHKSQSLHTKRDILTSLLSNDALSKR